MAVEDQVLIGAPERSDDPDVVGYALRAAANAADLPKGTTDTDPGGADDLGYVSEDGLAISIDRSVEYIRDWNLDQVRALLTEHEATVTFSLIGWTTESLRAIFGEENVDDSGADIVVRINSAMPAASSWVFKMKDLGVKRLVVIPNAVVASQGEIVFKKGEQTNLEIELSPLVDSAGEKIYIYTAKSEQAGSEG